MPFTLSLIITLPYLKGWISAVWLDVDWWRKLNYIPYAIFGIAWCRLVLFGRDSTNPSFLVRWHPRLGRFFVFLFLTLLIFGLITQFGPIGLVRLFYEIVYSEDIGDNIFLTEEFGIVQILILFCALYLLLRFSFVFPAIAIDKHVTPRMSWAWTRGCSFRLLAGFVLAFVPLHIVEVVLIDTVFLLTTGQSAFLSSDLESGFGFLAGIRVWGLLVGIIMTSLVYSILGYLWIAVVASLVCQAFRTCTGWIPASSNAPVGNIESQ